MPQKPLQQMERINIVGCPLGEVKTHLRGYGSIFIIHDRNVGGIVERLDIEAKGIFPIEATEERKTLSTLLEIEKWLLEEGADREAFVLGVGGGITTDIAGFAASVYKRGIINNKDNEYERAVNMLGNIHRQALEGAADTAVREYSGTLRELIASAAQVKAGIAGRDPDERGERRLLNLGHTFAHAIEKNSGETVPHGMAVSMGIILAARLAEALGLTTGLADRLKADFTACGLPVESPYCVDTLADAMKKDKKADGTVIHFVLPLGIGQVVTHDLRVEEAVEALTNSK